MRIPYKFLFSVLVVTALVAGLYLLTNKDISTTSHEQKTEANELSKDVTAQLRVVQRTLTESDKQRVLELSRTIEQLEQVSFDWSPEGPNFESKAFIEKYHEGLTSTGTKRFKYFDGPINSRWTTTFRSPGNLVRGQPTIITWSMAPDGTPMPGGGFNDNGNSDLISTFSRIFGSEANARNAFQSIEGNWGRPLSGINFIYNPNDDGVAFSISNAGSANRGDIRIGGHYIDGVGGLLGYAYSPNYGEVYLDTGDYRYANYSSGNFTTPALLHETGHALGLDHTCPVGFTQVKLMEPAINIFLNNPFYVKTPQIDEVRAVHRSYGDVFEFNNTPLNATNLGVIDNNPASSTVNGFLSIDDLTDQDYYLFTTGNNNIVAITVTPQGGNYSTGPFNNSLGACQYQFVVNANAIFNLNLTIFAADGTTIIATNNNNLPGNISIISFTGSTNTNYYLRVTSNTQLRYNPYDIRDDDGSRTVQLYSYAFSTSAAAQSPSSSGSTSASSTPSTSVSMSQTPSTTNSASLSASQSLTSSTTQSLTASVTSSKSSSATASTSVSPSSSTSVSSTSSTSVSATGSQSVSSTSSTSISSSSSTSISSSSSTSISSSSSTSVSATGSQSVSSTATASPSPSSTMSISVIPSLSSSLSISSSLSPTFSLTPSTSASLGLTATASPSTTASTSLSGSTSVSATGSLSVSSTSSTTISVSSSSSTSVSATGSQSVSSTATGSVSVSTTSSTSVSATGSLSASSTSSTSISTSSTRSTSTSTSSTSSTSISTSSTRSTSASATGSLSVSTTSSTSVSASSTSSTSISTSLSSSTSASATGSISISLTSSTSVSASPTSSTSVSATGSLSVSLTSSTSISASTTRSPSVSATASRSISVSSSLTPSRSVSSVPSASASIAPVVPNQNVSIYQVNVVLTSFSPITVNTNIRFNNMVVVCSQYNTANDSQTVVRVNRVSNSTFQVRLQVVNSTSSFRAIMFPKTVSCLAIEAGSYSFLEAGIVNSTTTSNAQNFDTSFYNLTTRRNYANAGIIGQVMSINDGRWSTFYSRSVDGKSSAVAGGNAFAIGKHSGRDTTSRASELVGYIVAEVGSFTISGRRFEVAKRQTNIYGLSNSPISVGSTIPLRGSLPSTSAALISSCSVRDVDGPWGVIYGSGPSALTTSSVSGAIMDYNDINVVGECASVFVFA